MSEPRNDPGQQQPWFTGQQQTWPQQSPSPQPLVRSGRRYSDGKRAVYGILWGFWTLMFFIGTIVAFSSGGVGTGLIGLILTALCGRYDYRIWTWQAKHLWFLILF